MKAMALVPAAVAAILALNISSASSQGGACAKQYQTCMDTCATRSSKQVQDGCFQGCESKNNFCAESVFGKRPVNGAPANAADQNGQSRDALAKKGEEAAQAQDSAKEQPAEERESQRGAKAAPQNQKAPPRAPAKH
jgi:hypothetical protein